MARVPLEEMMPPSLRRFFDQTVRIPPPPRFDGPIPCWPLSTFEVWLDYQLDLAAEYARMEVSIYAGLARAEIFRRLKCRASTPH
jgi:hypothetical protein